jgi:RNA polymerase sigma factor (sigma-70 family)
VSEEFSHKPKIEIDLNPSQEALVNREVFKVLALLPPNTTSREDLFGYAYLGLVEAANRFDPSRGVPFDAFATFRIRGAIYDGLKKMGTYGKGYQRLKRQILADELNDESALNPKLKSFPGLLSPVPAKRHGNINPSNHQQQPPPKDLTSHTDPSLISPHPATDSSVNAVTKQSTNVLDRANTNQSQTKTEDKIPLTDAERMALCQLTYRKIKELAIMCVTDHLLPKQSTPEEEVIEHEEKSIMKEAFEQMDHESKTLLTAVYDLNETGDNAASLAGREGVHRSTITRRHRNVLEKLKESYQQVQAKKRPNSP